MTSDLLNCTAASREWTYAYRPTLIGPPCEFTLKSDGLKWRIGQRAGLIPYDRVRAVRMSYRPVTMQSKRYLTEIWSEGNPKLQIASTSWRSIIEQERLDDAYTGFIVEFHRRLGDAGARTRFTAGVPVIIYWIGAIVFATVIVAMAILTVRALALEQWAGATIVGVLLLVFSLQFGVYFRRNWPTNYRPDAPPAHLLPGRLARDTGS